MGLFDAYCCVLLWGWVTSPREQRGKSLCDARSGGHSKEDDTDPEGNYQRIAPSQDEESKYRRKGMRKKRLKAQEQVEELEHGGDGSGDTPSRGPLPSWNFAPRASKLNLESKTSCVFIITTHRSPQLDHGTGSGVQTSDRLTTLPRNLLQPPSQARPRSSRQATTIK
ncbi:uncharacterized protein BO88DRAFT_235088 [Aspergillus vadensis CBS 113365]|uniref:Uncharacterized protein n=1 Tax=Aspergillus vadensis (strain CBS 113365 / IMI 142717 / IBT 24658) TaxID=1448311 RepID=A0A319BHI3_ASPVC|nr:hypothetical protein BO88DRAFT_235088 [Aspergillus vadensis CBS 113365]PYH71584.1 hypothetical protein BO88DRAFT_235088 [Aspergillus vadensis CBS 113365]